MCTKNSGQKTIWKNEKFIQTYDNIKKISSTEYEDVDWFHIVRDKIQWRTLLNTAMDTE